MAKKKKNINDMSFDELVDSLNELKQEVFNINIQKLAGQFEDTSQISKKKFVFFIETKILFFDNITAQKKIEKLSYKF